MIDCSVLEGQGIGGTGWRPFRGRWQRRIRFRSIANAPYKASAQRGFEASSRMRSDGDDHADIWPSRDLMLEQATDAAITAYEDVMRFGDPEGQACRAALRAYLEYNPDDTCASDEVVRAIASTSFGRVFQARSRRLRIHR